MSDLRAALTRLAEEGDARGAVAVYESAREVLRPPTRRMRAPWQGIAALVAVVAVLGAAAGLAVVSSSDDAKHHVNSGGVVRSLHLEATWLPRGFNLVFAGDDPSGGGGGSAEVDRAQRWVRFDKARRRALAVFDVQWNTPSPDPLQGFRLSSQPLEIRGRSGLFNSVLNAVVWEEPPGRAVLVISPDLNRQAIIEIANDLVPRGDGGFELPTPPDGFELAAEAPGIGSAGSNRRVIAYRDAHGRAVQVEIADHAEPPPGMNLYPSFNHARLVDVGGHDAVLATRFFDMPSVFRALGVLQPDLFLQWLETNDSRVTVSGVGLSQRQLVRIARGLRRVTERRWARIHTVPPLPMLGPSDLRPDFHIKKVQLYVQGQCRDFEKSVPCSQSHGSEIFATFTLANRHHSPDDHPGKACLVLFELFAGTTFENSHLSIGSTGIPGHPAQYTCTITDPEPGSQQGELPNPWHGDVQVAQHGRMTPRAFNTFVSQRGPSWAHSDVLAAWQFVGAGDSGGFIAIDEHRTSDDAATVVITVTDLPDDSTATIRYHVQVLRGADHLFRVASATAETRCRPGRGHRDFKTARCI